MELHCYFSDDISKVYTNLYSKPNQIRRAHKCYQCYYCNKFFLRPEKHKSHISNCSGAPGVIYNFNQNLISYQDNFCAKGDVPFIIYFDFETTAPTGNCFDPEQKKMFVVSYVMIGFSSRIKTKSCHNPKKLSAFNRTVKKLKFFYSRANQFY